MDAVTPNNQRNANISIVAIVGMPATGKSTVSHYISRQLAATWRPVEISLDDALDVQCPEGEVEFSKKLLYARHDSFFLLADDWRPKQMKLATLGVFSLVELANRLIAYRTLRPLFLLEFPLTELPTLVDRITDDSFANCVLVLLTARRDICIARNRQRGVRAQVPLSAMSYFYDSIRSINVSWHCDRLRTLGWHILEQNTEGSIDEVVPRVGRAIEEAVRLYL